MFCRSLFPDSDCLSAIVDQALFEPRMLQRLLSRDALLGIVDENLPEQIEELFVEGGIGWYEFLWRVSKEEGRRTGRLNIREVVSWL